MDRYLEEKFRSGLMVEKLDRVALMELGLIIDAYNESHRHYHNIKHIFELFNLCDKFSVNAPNIYLAIFYHDVIYSTLFPGNEEKSARYAKRSLMKIGIQNERIDTVVKMILATKNHLLKNSDPETQIFLDLDFCIVGYPIDQYKKYVLAIREEYSNLPEFVFKKGRKKFLEVAVNSINIFQSALFETEFGNQAKINIRQELKNL